MWEAGLSMARLPISERYSMENNYLNAIQALGVGGVFALIVIEKVFAFVTRNRHDGNSYKYEIRATLSTISKAIERQTDILDRMYSDCQRCREEMTRISGKLNGQHRE
jgi:hypothetical protein